MSARTPPDAGAEAHAPPQGRRARLGSDHDGSVGVERALPGCRGARRRLARAGQQRQRERASGGRRNRRTPAVPGCDPPAPAQHTATAATPAAGPEGTQPAEVLPRTLVTLAVTQADAERVLFASTHGELSFGLLDEDSKVKPGPGVSLSNLFR